MKGREVVVERVWSWNFCFKYDNDIFTTVILSNLLYTQNDIMTLWQLYHNNIILAICEQFTNLYVVCELFSIRFKAISECKMMSYVNTT